MTQLEQLQKEIKNRYGDSFIASESVEEITRRAFKAGLERAREIAVAACPDQYDTTPTPEELVANHVLREMEAAISKEIISLEK